MGGYGSGRRSGKQKQDGLIRIDLLTLHRNNALVEGRVSILKMNKGDRYLGSVQITAAKDQLIIDSRIHGTISGQNKHIIQTVDLIRTPCHFGGDRPWMRCPGCHRKVLILYIGSGCIRCRHCFNLTYECCNHGDVDQHLLKVRKARRRIGADIDLSQPLPPKQKWKHNKKYNHLKKKAEQLELRFFRSLENKLQLMNEKDES